jgi:ATP-dependent RNA helicase DHX29
MSATVDAEKISDFFGGCPTLHVPGRTFAVDVRYLEDAVEYTKWSISETSPYARRCRPFCLLQLNFGSYIDIAVHDKFYRTKARADWSEDNAARDDEDDEDVQENVKLEKRYSPETATTINLLDERLIPYDLIIRLLERLCFEDADYASYSSAILVFMPGMGEIRRLNDLLSEHALFGASADFRIYPLHSTLSSENQGAVFDIPPAGTRKIVIGASNSGISMGRHSYPSVATNIAETGITIPDITCVIDTGKYREMRCV